MKINILIVNRGSGILLQYSKLLQRGKVFHHLLYGEYNNYIISVSFLLPVDITTEVPLLVDITISAFICFIKQLLTNRHPQCIDELCNKPNGPFCILQVIPSRYHILQD